MRRLTLLFAILLAGAVSAATMYKWVDEDGVVHFSDTPRPGAEEVQIEEAQTFSAPAPTTTEPTAQEPESVRFEYRTVEIATPTEDETLWNIEGVLDVGIRLDPSLQQGHSLRLYLDGQAVDGAAQGTAFRVDEVWRGTHKVWVVVNDANGRQLQRSDTRTFHVQQTRVGGP